MIKKIKIFNLALLIVVLALGVIIGLAISSKISLNDYNVFNFREQISSIEKKINNLENKINTSKDLVHTEIFNYNIEAVNDKIKSIEELSLDKVNIKKFNLLFDRVDALEDKLKKINGIKSIQKFNAKIDSLESDMQFISIQIQELKSNRSYLDKESINSIKDYINRMEETVKSYKYFAGLNLISILRYRYANDLIIQSQINNLLLYSREIKNPKFKNLMNQINKNYAASYAIRKNVKRDLLLVLNKINTNSSDLKKTSSWIDKSLINLSSIIKIENTSENDFKNKKDIIIIKDTLEKNDIKGALIQLENLSINKDKFKDIIIKSKKFIEIAVFIDQLEKLLLNNLTVNE